MVKSKKLGAFGGVFVPSILTILGVIMYMRLPWIVGQAGLISALGIIFVAHIISITTGLSISSIATDKKVKAGGTYYMISRSMGLPIGGTLGLALFVGLSFSVSLYLIGFAEAFLGFFNMDSSKNSIRLTGFIVLSIVTLLTFISTKLAIKTQFFILIAMVLSLMSIFWGSHEYAPALPNFFGTGEALPWIVLFGIFFPAVTGFEAGVSMSGDLSNPNKALPRGTISAIAVGLIMYVILAFFFSFTVSGDVLQNNPNVLFDISRFRYFVVAGIWGATLSSALGSILAAPRILQAISIDKITPRFFAKGYGSLNEPRNALLLSFVIATAGIMIGELNVIARIVTSFFIITYGFLNLSCFIESWASSDFRPSFKIPPAVSIIGALACFIVMIQLDLLAMIVATILLAAIFFYLKRKELVLRSGDAWNSVWASIVRTGLLKLKKQKLKIRNWRPNIILFSGGLKTRPHLLEIGTDLIGKMGILTDFELIEEKGSDNIITKCDEDEELKNADYNNNIFQKKYHCTNVYKGIESVAQLYGFSGVEPNSMLLGFPNDPAKLDDFLKVFKISHKLKLNSIFIKYNKTKAFGQRKDIHIWWDGEKKNFYLGLSLLRFLMSGIKWRHAKCTLHFINNYNIPEENIESNIKSLLNSYRISIDVNIINNTIENLPALELIVNHSDTADLIIYELPNPNAKNAADTLKYILKKTAELPSIMFLDANSSFEAPTFLAQKGKESIKARKQVTDDITSQEVIELPETHDVLLNQHLQLSKHEIEALLFSFYNQSFVKVQKQNIELSYHLQQVVKNAFTALEKSLDIKNNDLRKKEFYRIWNDTLFKIKKITETHINKEFLKDKETWAFAIDNLLHSFEQFIKPSPDVVKVTFKKEAYALKRHDKLRLKWHKAKQKAAFAFFTNTKIEKIAYKKTLDQVLKPRIFTYLKTLFTKHQNNTYHFINEVHKINQQIRNSFYHIEAEITKNTFNTNTCRNYLNDISSNIAAYEEVLSSGIKLYKKSIFTILRREMSLIIFHLEKPGFKYYLKSTAKSKSTIQRTVDSLKEYPSLWLENTRIYAHQLYLDLLLQSLATRIKAKIHKSYNDVLVSLNKGAEDNFKEIHTRIKSYKEHTKAHNSFEYNLDNIYFNEISLTEIFEDLYDEIKNLNENLPKEINLPHPSFKKHSENFSNENLPLLNVDIKAYLENFFEVFFPEKIDIIIRQFEGEINKKIRKLNNLLSLSRYNIDNMYISEDAKTADSKQLKIQYLENFGKSLKTNQHSFSDMVEAFTLNLSTRLEEAFQPLAIRHMLSTKESYGKSKKKLNNKVGFAPLRFVKKNIYRFAEAVFYGRSRGIILAKSIQSETKSYNASMDRLLEFSEKHMPDKEVMEKLPFYYKNLFNNKYTVNERFWVGRTKELARAAETVQHFKNGSRGGIMVLGERNSGKTSLCNLIAQRHFQKDNMYQLYPLRHGSCRIENFSKVLSETTGKQGSVDDIMKQLPSHSCIIINDLALWWERTAEGDKVVKLICSLIKKYAHKTLFIINANSISYHYINKMLNMDDYFLSLIKCEPFSTRQLRDLVLLRHQSSELKFKIGKMPEKLMIEWRYAQLFNEYFNYTDGVVGTALNAWLSHISSIKDKEITITKPRKPDYEVFNVLSKDKLVIIIQLILHRRLNKQRISKIIPLDSHSLDISLHYLTASKVLSKMSNNVYMINPYIEPHIVKFLKHKELI